MRSAIAITLAIYGTAFLAAGCILPAGDAAELACFGGMVACFAAAMAIDPDLRFYRARAYRRAQRRRREDGQGVPRCGSCRVIVFPDGTTERVPCEFHADIRSVALDWQVRQ